MLFEKPLNKLHSVYWLDQIWAESNDIVNRTLVVINDASKNVRHSWSHVLDDNMGFLMVLRLMIDDTYHITSLVHDAATF